MGKRKTHKEFVEEVYGLVGNEYSVLTKYKNSQTKLFIKHNECGYVWEITPNNFLRGRRCPKCAGLMRKTTKQFKQEVYEQVGDEYVVLGNYVNKETKIKIKHNKCGHVWEVKPGNFLNNKTRCPKCFGVAYHKTKNTNIFKKEVKQLTGNEYTVLGEYMGTHTKILIKHNSCGNKYFVTPNKFLLGNRCPKCKTSKGENKVRLYLQNNNYDYREEYTFKNCKRKQELPFDFAIFNSNALLFLIEYDGEQHFKPIEVFGGEERFKEQRKNDKIKNKFCQLNNIPLIRIPYYTENINKYLDDKIEELNIAVQLEPLK